MRSDTGAYLRPRLHAVNGRRRWPNATLPSWARWNGEPGQRYTLGVEEELMLLNPHAWSLAQSSDEVIARLSEGLSAHVSPETHASVIEVTTGVHADVDGVVAELASLRTRLADELCAMGLRVAAAGTHPLTLRDELRSRVRGDIAPSKSRGGSSPGGSPRRRCMYTWVCPIPRMRSGC